MQALPPEGYQPLPPNPPEDNYRGEVENQSDAWSVVAPLLDNSGSDLVTVENPTPAQHLCQQFLSNHFCFV
jgi:hypothetical protein